MKPSNTTYCIPYTIYRAGFTLLEVIIVMAIVAVIAAIGIGSYGSFTKSIDLDSAQKTMLADIKTVQNRAIAGIDADGDGVSDQWGICFRNPIADPAGDLSDRYEIVSPPPLATDAAGSCFENRTTTASLVKSIVYLPSGVTFSTPAPGAARLLVFNKITGATTDTADVNIIFSSGSSQRTVTISPVGLASVSSFSITSISPPSAPNTGAVSDVSIVGTGFETGATVKLNKGSTDITCTGFTVASSTSMTGGSCPITDALSGTWNVVVTQGTSSVTLTNGFTVTASPPTVSAVSPSHAENTAPVGGLTITGTGFQTGATVRLDKSGQSSLSCTYTGLTSTSITGGSCDITDRLGATGWEVVVTNTTDNQSCLTGADNCIATFTIDNPDPEINVVSPAPAPPALVGLVPATANAGSGDTTVTVNGTNFVENPATGASVSVVRWTDALSATTDLVTTFISKIQLTAVIPLAKLASACATCTISVFNPTPVGGTSTARTFTVVTVGDTITSLTGSTASCNTANTCINTAPLIGGVIVGSGFTNVSPIHVSLSKSGQSTIYCTADGTSTGASTFTYTSATTLSNGICNIVAKTPAASPSGWTINVCLGATLDACSGGTLISSTAGVFTITRANVTVTRIVSSQGSNASATGSPALPIIAIVGAGFQNGATVQLTKSGQTAITCGAFTVVNTTTLAHGTCNIVGKAAGAWDVVVVNSSPGDLSSGTCEGCFTVLDSLIPANVLNEYYWIPYIVSGSSTGNWNDGTHWSHSSGGLAAATVPDSNSNVYFDANSFDSDGRIVTVNVEPNVKNISFAGATRPFTFTGNFGTNVSGSLDFSNDSVTITRSGFTGGITFNSSLANEVINLGSGSPNLWSTIFVGSAGGTGGYVMAHPYNNTSAGNNISITSGSLDTNAKNMTFGTLSVSSGATLTTNAGTITLGDSSGTIWSMDSGATYTTGAATDISVTGTGGVAFAGGGKTYRDITFANSTGTVSLSSSSGTNTFRTATFTGSGTPTISSSTFTGAVSITGAATISTNNTFSSTLTVSGAGASSVATNNTFTGNASFAGTTTISGHGNSPATQQVCTDSTLDNTFTGTLTTTGAGDNLVIDGSCNTFTGAVSIGGVLTMNANKNRNTFSSTLTASTSSSAISNVNTFTGAVSIAGSAVIGTENTFSSTLEISGATGTTTINSGNGTANVFNNTVTIATASATVGGPNTWNSGSSLVLSGATPTLSGATTTFKTVTMTGSGTAAITGTNTFVNLNRSPSVAAGITFPVSVTQTITGTLTLAGASAANRLSVSSSSATTRATLSAANVSLSNVDFLDIAATGTGTASGSCDGGFTTWCGTSLGNLGNNTGINFADGATRYWVQGNAGCASSNIGNWSDADCWSATSGGATCSCLPLSQDTARFDGASFTSGGQTVNVDVVNMAKDVNFTNVTNSPTISFSVAATMYGSLTLWSITTSGNTLTMAGTGSITSNGVALASPLVINSSSATITLQDAFSSSSSLTLTAGTLNANNKNVTALTFSASSGTTLTMCPDTCDGSATGRWTLSGTGTAWNFAGTTLNNPTGSKIVLSSSSNKDFTGGGKTYYDLSITGSAGTTVIDENNIFRNFDSNAGNLTINGTTHTSTARTTKFSGTFTTTGSGTVTLNDDSTEFEGVISISGDTTINGASNTFGNDSADSFTTTGTKNLTFTATNADANIFNGAVTVGGNLTMGTGATGNQFQNTTNALTVNGTGTSTVSASNIFGTVSVGGPVTFTSAGAGNLTLEGSNTFHGPFSYTSSTGDLNISAAGNTFNSTFGHTSSGTGDLTFTGGTNNITGAATITMNGGGALTIGGANTFGDFTLTGSNLGASTISGANTYGNFVFTGSNGGSLTFSSTGTTNYSNLTVNQSPDTAGQKTVKFQSGSTHTISGKFIAHGFAGCLGATTCTVLSMNGGTLGVNHWNISAATANSAADISYLKVDGSAATGAATPFVCSITLENCLDGTGNSGWTFVTVP